MNSCTPGATPESAKGPGYLIENFSPYMGRCRSLRKGKVQMKSRIRAPRPLWIITRFQNNYIDALIMESKDKGGALPVFSSEESAEAFMHFLEADEKRG